VKVYLQAKEKVTAIVGENIEKNEDSTDAEDSEYNEDSEGNEEQFTQQWPESPLFL